MTSNTASLDATALQTAVGFLQTIFGPERVITAPDRLAYYAADISGEAAVLPAVIVRPETADEVGRAVQILTDMGLAIVPRGAGYSYSGGALPAKAPTAIFDLSDLNRIVEINEADRYVTVEAGCTWAALYEALKAKGLRTPFFGPLSGVTTTVGGAASNNAQFFGSGAYGAMADSVLSLDVVLANGGLIQTGSAAGEGRTPFLRHFGPDLTGLFLGDCGAFGLKLRVTLTLMPVPASEGYLSFAFDRFEDLAEAQVALAHENVVAEQWGIDPEGNEALLAQGFTFLEGLTFSRDMSAADEIQKQLVDGHRAAMRGGYTLHLVVEGTSEKEVELKLGRARRVLVPMALRELPATIPHLARANPFLPIVGLLGLSGENWLPCHGLFPFSKASTIVAITDEYFVRHRDDMAKAGVRVSYVTGTVNNAFVLEPMFLWKDRLHAFHLAHVTDAQRKAYADTPEDKAARELVVRLRRDIIGLWDTFGASHFQIGKLYDYAESMSSAGEAMILALKNALDPRGLMNPGALQLGMPKVVRTTTKFAEFPQNLLDEK